MNTEIRSLFISDSHLGMRLARGTELAELLESTQPQFLYLVGDILDAWALRSRWHWPPEYNRIVNRIVELAESGTQVRYTPGNHDAFMRGALPQIDAITIANQFVHETSDGRTLVVIHGDLLDRIERRMEWLSRFGTFFYAQVIRVNLVMNWVLKRLGAPPWFFCFTIKRLSKRVLGAYGRFNAKLINHAKSQNVDGIVCGHVHKPQMNEVDGVIYLNTGDWLENSSFLLELSDGTLVLNNHRAEVSRMTPILRSNPVEHSTQNPESLSSGEKRESLR